MTIQQALNHILQRRDLPADAMREVMHAIMTGQCTPAQIAGFIIALRMKGETVDEIAAAAKVMRELSTRVPASGEHLVDTCGTGGDGANLFNVSTASAFVASAAGARVAKHGNRGVSSASGSADVLEQAGVVLSLTPEQVGRCIEEIGIGFMFAPSHHSAMKHAIGPRKELAVRTLFNVLGPLTNPAGVKRQVVGVFDAAWCRPLAEVLHQLGSEQVMVVHADDGLDEISLAAPTQVAELKQGDILEYRITPEQLGVEPDDLSGLDVSDAADSYQLIRGALGFSRDARAEKATRMIALNAGAAIYVAGVSMSLKQGVEMALDALYGGMANEKIADLVGFTAVFKDNAS